MPNMNHPGLQRLLPRFLRNYVLQFEATIDRRLSGFADSLKSGARVLDAGAGEGRHARYFDRHRYIALDLAVGDPSWD